MKERLDAEDAERKELRRWKYGVGDGLCCEFCERGKHDGAEAPPLNKGYTRREFGRVGRGRECLRCLRVLASILARVGSSRDE